MPPLKKTCPTPTLDLGDYLVAGIVSVLTGEPIEKKLDERLAEKKEESDQFCETVRTLEESFSPGDFNRWRFGLDRRSQHLLAEPELLANAASGFILFAIRYDEALEAAKKAAVDQTPEAKRDFLRKVDEACEQAELSGMSSENLEKLRKYLLGRLSYFKSHPKSALESHASSAACAALAEEYGLDAMFIYFTRRALDEFRAK